MTSQSDESDIVVDKWDGGQVKNVLDETAKLVFLKSFRYEESNLLVDIRLFLCVLPVLSALVALLYDYLYPFPASASVLKLCVYAYLFFMVILTIYSNFVETNTIFIGSKKKGTDNVKLISKMKRYHHIYTIILERNGKQVASISVSVGNYFDTNGTFLHNKFNKLVRSLNKTKNI